MTVSTIQLYINEVCHNVVKIFIINYNKCAYCICTNIKQSKFYIDEEVANKISLASESKFFIIIIGVCG